jgi:hypothetical protein
MTLTSVEPVGCVNSAAQQKTSNLQARPIYAPPHAARKTRSLSSSRGQEIWRRSTASSWRRTTISSSLNSRERSRSAVTASTRSSRHSNDTTKKQPPSARFRRRGLYGRDRGPRRSPNHRMDLRTRQGRAGSPRVSGTQAHFLACSCGFLPKTAFVSRRCTKHRPFRSRKLESDLLSGSECGFSGLFAGL